MCCMVSEEKYISLLCAHVCIGFVHAHMCKGEWLGGPPILSYRLLLQD